MTNYMPGPDNPTAANDWTKSTTGVSSWVYDSDLGAGLVTFTDGGYIQRVLSEFNPGAALPLSTRYASQLQIQRISGTGLIQGVYLGVWKSGEFRYASVPLSGFRSPKGKWLTLPLISPVVTAGNNYNGSGSNEGAAHLIIYGGAGTSRWAIRNTGVYDLASAPSQIAMDPSDLAFGADIPTDALTVDFTHDPTLLNEHVNNFKWQFGDASADVLGWAEDYKTISHTFPTAGTYTVTLRGYSYVQTDNGVAQSLNSQNSKTLSVTVPSGTYSAKFTSTGSYRDVAVDGSSSVGDKIDLYSWDWGDGTAITNGEHASHTYTADGTYNITLTITNSLGQSSSVVHQFTAVGAPTAAVNFTTVRDLLSVAFLSSVQTGGGTYSWNFGDGSPADTTANPTHVYAAGGQYTVTLTYTLSGVPTSVSKIITVDEKYTTLDRVIDYLKLEVELPPGTNNAYNLVKNPNGELGGYFWNTPAPNSYIVGTNVSDNTTPGGLIEGWKLVLRGTGDGATSQTMITDMMRVDAGESVKASIQVPMILGTAGYWRANFTFYDLSGATLSSSGFTGYLTPGPGSVATAAFTAPASTYYATLNIVFYSNNSGAVPTVGNYYAVVKRVMVATAVNENLLKDSNPNFDTDIKKWQSASFVVNKVWNSASQRLRGISTNPQLLTNPTFDVDASNWNAGTNSTIARTTTAPQAGAGCLSVTAVAAGNTYCYANAVTVSAGVAYVFGAYVKTAVTARSCTMKIEWLNSSNAVISTTSGTASNDSTSWVLRTVSGTAPAGTVSARVRVDWASAAAGEVHYIDSCYLFWNSAMSFLNDDYISVVPGEVLNGAATFYSAGTVQPVNIQVLYYNASKTFVNFSTYSPGTNDAAGGTTVNSNFTVPAGAVYARFVAFYSAGVALGEIHDIDSVSLSGLPRWFQFLAYQDSENWIDILDSAFNIHIAREELSLGEMDVSILDTELDPAVKDILRPGRAIRLRAQTEDPLGNVQYESIFTGEIGNANVSYLRQNVYWVDDVGRAQQTLRTNWFSNPSYENNLTGWAGDTIGGTRDVPSAAVVSATRSTSGGFSAKLTIPVSSKGVFWCQSITNIPRDGGLFTASFDVWVPTGVTVMPRVTIKGFTSGAAYSATLGNWQKISVTFDPSVLTDTGGNKGTAVIGIEFPAAISSAFDIYVDAALAEFSTAPGSYFDGYSTDPDAIVSYGWVSGTDSQSIQFIPGIPFVAGHFEAVPERRSTQIELTAFDAMSDFADQPEPRGVYHISELPFLLEGKDIPYQVNGSSAQVASATQVSSNDNASIVDQIAITRDTEHGYAFVNRNNVLVAYDPAHEPTSVVYTYDEDDYTGIDVNFNTDNCINDVTITYLRYNSAEKTTEEITYGPYRDAASVDAWGLHHKDFTIQGIVESSVNMQAFANDVFTANNTPLTRVNALKFPIIYAQDLKQGKALVDLYDLVGVNYAAKSIAHQVRVAAIEHEITVDGWDVGVAFAPDGAVASPQVTPTVVNSPTTVGDGTLSEYTSSDTTSLTTNSTYGPVTPWSPVIASFNPYGTFTGGVFTFTRGGTFLINATANYAGSATGRRLMMLFKNGSEVRRVDVGSGGVASPEIVHAMKVSAGDTMELRVYQSSGGALALTGGHTIQLMRTGD